MSDLKITDLAALAEADVATGDLLPIVDVSADGTKKVTAGDLITASIDFLASGAIPIAKVDTTGISLAADSVGSSQISTGAVGSDELATGSVTNVKLASGSLTADKFGTQAANVVLAGPTGGVDATPTFRALDPADLPLATTTTVGGAIIPTSGGLAVDVAGNVTINNSVTPASFGWIDHDAKGLITGSRALLGSDVPVAAALTRGTVAVSGSGLAMSGDLIQHSNSVVGADVGFVTYDDQGHITAARPLLPFDLPPATVTDLGAVSVGSGLSVTALGELSVGLGDASTVGGYALGPEFSVNGSNQLTLFSVATNLLSGLIVNGQLDTGAVDGTNLATQSTCKIASSLPANGDYTGQLFYNTTNADLLLWDGNTYRTVSTAGGTLILAGTYDASTNLLDSVTVEGAAVGYVNGAALPSASATNKGYYVVVSQSGTGVAPAPLVTLEPPDLLLSTGAAYQLIENSQTISGQIALNVGFTPVGSIAATNVQSALAEVDSEKLAKAGDTMTGALGIIAGSESSPGLFVSGDTNTGIYFPGADQVAISTGGTGRLFVDSSGRLLVGTSSDSGGALLQVNGDRVRIATAKTPASATDTGTAGEICWDANYVYVCVATNTWKRSALSTW